MVVQDDRLQEVTTHTESKDKNFIDVYLRLLTLSSLLYSAFFCLNYLSLPIVELQGFRQTQTALTSYYLLKNGFRLDYWTPVIGYPWSVPFEFPLYQEIVALISQWTNFPLTNTGRLVSWFFTVLTCLPIYKTLQLYAISERARYFILSLYLTAPIYLFWGPTFMIESTALFLSFCGIYYFSRILVTDTRCMDYCAAGIFLSLGLLQKVTTALPITLVLLFIFLSLLLKSSQLNYPKPKARHALAVLIGCFMIAYAWIECSDLIKSKNLIGQSLTSKGLTLWNYGTLEQRVSKELLMDVFWLRIAVPNLSGVFGMSTLLAFISLTQDKKLKLVVISLCLFGLLPLYVFTNLHIVHDYYQMSNTVYFVIAIGISVTALAQKYLVRQQLLYLFFVTLYVIGNIYGFATGYYNIRIQNIDPENNLELKISNFIKTHSNETDAIVWYGFDWSSAPAFYSERKSLTVPQKLLFSPIWDGMDERVTNRISTYLGQEPAFIVLCPYPNADTIRAELIKHYPRYQITRVDTCEVFSMRLI